MLSRAAIRICAVQALMGKTIAGDRVLDSEINTLDEGLENERRPFIAVYTDDYSSTEGMTVVFEIGVTSRMRMVNPETNEISDEDGVPQTDGAMEIVLDALERQIHAQLKEPGSPWGDCFRSLFGRPSSIASLRGSDAKNGLRFAARQIKIVGTPLADPPLGVTPRVGSPWLQFIALVQGADDPGLAAQARLFEALIGSGSAATDWQTLYRLLGLADAHDDALGRSQTNATIPEELTVVIEHPGDVAAQPEGGLA